MFGFRRRYLDEIQGTMKKLRFKCFNFQTLFCSSKVRSSITGFDASRGNVKIMNNDTTREFPTITYFKFPLRSIPKCPQSAPAKSAKSRIIRLSTVTSIPEKMLRSKLKDHPISKLNLTPSANRLNAREKDLTSEKCLTTPRNRNCLTKKEPFLSAKHHHKALFSNIKEEKIESMTPSDGRNQVSEVCNKMRKLNISSLRKDVPSRYLCISSTSKATSGKGEESAIKSAKKGNESAMNLKKKKKRMSCSLKSDRITGRKCNINEPNEAEVDDKSGGSSSISKGDAEASSLEESTSVEREKEDIEKDSDDNKENLSENDKTGY